jgi:hypothetical protein
MLHKIKPAIYDCLQELYDDTFHLQNETTLYTNYPIDTSDLLQEIREYVTIAVNYLLQNDESRIFSQLDAIEKLCEDGLTRLGHRVGYNSATGPYSVRLSTIARIRKMIDFSLPFRMPEYNKYGWSYYMPYGDTKVRVNCTSVYFNKYGVVYHLHPELFCVDGTMNTSHPYDDMENYESNHLPYFMTSETYEKIDL